MKYYKERLDEPIVLDRGTENGFQYRIYNIGTHPCAYIGVDIEHPLAGHDYDNLPINVHGGLTYARKGRGGYLPLGYWWYGWDYAHAGDYVGYKTYVRDKSDDKKWITDEIKKHVWDVSFQFKQLAKLAETIQYKTKEETKKIINE